MRHLMVDIETLGIQPDAAFFNIGVVPFDIETGESGEGYASYIDLNTIDNTKFSYSPGTIKFWFNELDKNKHYLENGGITMQSVLIGVNEFIRKTFDIIPFKIWSKSPSFDLTILKHALNVYSLPILWEYFDELDVRTMEFLNKAAYLEAYNNFKQHDGLQDCYAQIKGISAVYRSLKIV